MACHMQLPLPPFSPSKQVCNCSHCSILTLGCSWSSKGIPGDGALEVQGVTVRMWVFLLKWRYCAGAFSCYLTCAFLCTFKGHTLQSDSDPSPPFLPWGYGACGKGCVVSGFSLYHRLGPGTDGSKIQIFMLIFLLLIYLFIFLSLKNTSSYSTYRGKNIKEITIWENL